GRRIVGHHPQNGGKSLVLHHWRVVGNAHDRRFDINAPGRYAVGDAAATANDFTALLARRGQGVVHGRQGALADQRADQFALLARVTNGQRRVSGFHLRDKFIGHAVVHDQAAQRRAALAGGTDGGEQRTLDGQLPVRIRRHHDGVVASEFQNTAPQAGGHGLPHLAPHRNGAGGRNQRQTLVGGQRLTDFGFADHHA